MSWQCHITSLMADGSCQDCAIVQYKDPKVVLAGQPCGKFLEITPAEIEVLIGSNREDFFIKGLWLGKQRCSVLRDDLFKEGYSMDLKTKGEEDGPKYCIAVGRAHTVLVILMAIDGTSGGNLNMKAARLASYLRENNF